MTFRYLSTSLLSCLSLSVSQITDLTEIGALASGRSLYEIGVLSIARALSLSRYRYGSTLKTITRRQQ